MCRNGARTSGRQIRQADARHLVGIGGVLRARTTRGRVGDEGVDFLQADGVEIGVGVVLQVVATADAGITLDGAATARLVGRGSVAVATGTVAQRTIEGVVASELMADFVCYEIDVERVSDRIRQARGAPCLDAAADHAQASDAATAGGEDVANVVIGGADGSIDHRRGVVDDPRAITGEWIRRGDGVHQVDVVGHQLQLHGQIVVVDLVDAVHCHHDGGLPAGCRTPAYRRNVVMVRCDGQAVCAHHRANLGQWRSWRLQGT